MKKKGIELDERDMAHVRATLMGMASDAGVTVEEYARFMETVQKLGSIGAAVEYFQDLADEEIYSGAPEPDARKPRFGLAPKPLADAGSKTLRLKIKMQDVTKPPMWREAMVPAEFNFSQLHYVIQAVTGLHEEHLWQFQRKAYDQGVQIGIPMEDTESGFGIEDCTHKSDETPVTAFLCKKGDKFTYVYDFGDDWIFDISVEDVLDRQGEVAECTKWKSDLQPMENTGGIYAYCQLREFYDNFHQLNKKEREAIAGGFGYDNAADLYDEIEENMIDIELVNETLSEIPDKWDDIYC